MLLWLYTYMLMGLCAYVLMCLCACVPVCLCACVPCLYAYMLICLYAYGIRFWIGIHWWKILYFKTVYRDILIQKSYAYDYGWIKILSVILLTENFRSWMCMITIMIMIMFNLYWSSWNIQEMVCRGILILLLTRPFLQIHRNPVELLWLYSYVKYEGKNIHIFTQN